MQRLSHASTESSPPIATFESRSDAYYWRLIGTALSFVAFGLGALLLSLTVMPVLRLLPQPRSQRAARRVMQSGMRTFVRLMRGLGVLTYDFAGAERLGEPGQLIVANHPTLIDAVFLIAFTPQPVCVAKSAMFRNPLTRHVVAACRFISNASTAGMIEGASAALKRGECVIMFPEGTRTQPGQPLAFHRGAANVGVRAAERVTPVYIACSPVTLTKGEPWYRIPRRRPHFSFKVGEDFPMAPHREQAAIPIASRLFNVHLCERFQRELPRVPGYTGDGPR